jgi:hypothetical protein
MPPLRINIGINPNPKPQNLISWRTTLNPCADRQVTWIGVSLPILTMTNLLKNTVKHGDIHRTCGQTSLWNTLGSQNMTLAVLTNGEVNEDHGLNTGELISPN